MERADSHLSLHLVQSSFWFSDSSGHLESESRKLGRAAHVESHFFCSHVRALGIGVHSGVSTFQYLGPRTAYQCKLNLV